MILIFIPAIYYLILAIHLYNKRGSDVSFVMSVVYLISALCAIVIYLDTDSSYKDFHSYQLGVIPTFLFCFVPTLFILPFYKYNSCRIRKVEVLKDTKLFDRICYLYIFLFFLNIYICGNLVVEALTSNLGELRDSVYMGEEIDLTKGMSTPMRILFYIPLTIGGGALFMIVFFFYSIAFLNKSKTFNFFIFLSSLSPIYAGITTASRTAIAYWGLMFLFCFFLFKNYLKKKTIRGIYYIFVFFGSLMVFYFMAVSIARFEEATGGTSGGILGYAGQPYLEYSNLWETIPSQFRSLKNIFPWGNLFFWNHTAGVVQASEIAGYPINGFNTIMGIFYVDLGRFSSLIVLSVFCLAIRHFVSKNTKKSFNLSSIITVFLFAVIPLTGIFNYYYYSTDTVFAFFFFLYLASRFKKVPREFISINKL